MKYISHGTVALLFDIVRGWVSSGFRCVHDSNASLLRPMPLHIGGVTSIRTDLYCTIVCPATGSPDCESQERPNTGQSAEVEAMKGKRKR